MKRLLCLLLMLCLLASLYSCSTKPVEETNFPTEVEALHPIVEGTRIPFKRVAIVEDNRASHLAFVLRSKEEVEEAIEKGIIQKKELQNALLQKDYELYQILGIKHVTNTTRAGWGEDIVTELINTGELTAVYSFTRADLPENSEQNWIETADVVGHVTIMLIRKSDYDFSDCEDNLNLDISKKRCYTLYPDRVEDM